MWIGEKLHFSRVAWNSKSRRFSYAFGVRGIFCSLEACTMHGQISALWVIKKVGFFKFARDN